MAKKAATPTLEEGMKVLQEENARLKTQLTAQANTISELNRKIGEKDFIIRLTDEAHKKAVADLDVMTRDRCFWWEKANLIHLEMSKIPPLFKKLFNINYKW